jgi:hypothetical protein
VTVLNYFSNHGQVPEPLPDLPPNVKPREIPRLP